MEITEFALNEPDDDGDMTSTLTVDLDNESKHDVRLLRTQVIFSNPDGAVFASNTSTQDTRVDAGESFSISPTTPWARVRFCGDSRDNVTARVRAYLYRREFIKLGEADLPADEHSCTTHAKTIKSECIGNKAVVLVGRSAPDGDGDLQVLLLCGIANQGKARLDQVTLKAELLDEDDSVIDSSEASEAVDAGGEEALEVSIWGVNKRMIKKARVRMSLSIFHLVHSTSCEALSTPAD